MNASARAVEVEIKTLQALIDAARGNALSFSNMCNTFVE